MMANAYQSESAPIRPAQHRLRERGVAEERIDEALREHAARKAPNWKLSASMR